MLGPDRLFADAESLFGQTDADGVEVSFWTHEKGMTRFANSYIHQNMAEQNRTCTIRVAYGQQTGVASGNDVSPEGLTRTLRTAETIARLSKANPHFPGFSEPHTYAKIKSHDPATAVYGPIQRAEALKKVFDSGDKQHVNLAGAFFNGEEELAIASSTGLRAYQPNTHVFLNVIAITPTYSGAAQGISRRIADVDVVKIGETAIAKAILGQNPIDLDLGQYDVFMEPSAIAEIVEWIGYVGLGSRSIEEQTSFLAGRHGEQLAGANITMYDNATEGGYGWAFDQEGTPKQEVHFLERGVAQDAVFDRISGHKLGKPSTGHMAGPTSTGEGSAAMHIHFKPGTEPAAKILERIERGIYITRTHYVNGLLDPRQLLMTGLTRDGAFLIENGKLTKGIRNMRFTQSILESLNKVEALSIEREPCPAWWGAAGSYLMPSMHIKDFTFTGKTDH